MIRVHARRKGLKQGIILAERALFVLIKTNLFYLYLLRKSIILAKKMFLFASGYICYYIFCLIKLSNLSEQVTFWRFQKDKMHFSSFKKDMGHFSNFKKGRGYFVNFKKGLSILEILKRAERCTLIK